LGARVVAGRRTSHRNENKLSTKMLESRTLRAFRLTIAKAMKKFKKISLFIILRIIIFI